MAKCVLPPTASFPGAIAPHTVSVDSAAALTDAIRIVTRGKPAVIHLRVKSGSLTIMQVTAAMEFDGEHRAAGIGGRYWFATATADTPDGAVIGDRCYKPSNAAEIGVGEEETIFLPDNSGENIQGDKLAAPEEYCIRLQGQADLEVSGRIG